MDFADEMAAKLYSGRKLWSFRIGAAELEIAEALRYARNKGIEEAAEYAEGGFDDGIVMLTTNEIRQIAQEIRNLKSK